MFRFSPILALALLALPSVAAASAGDTLSEIAGLFNIFVGLMLVLSIVLFAAAGIMWIVRLGTWPTYRDEAIHMMEWAVAILFVLVVLLGIVQFIQTHTQTALYILALAIVIFVVWLIIISGVFAGGEKKEEEE